MHKDSPTSAELAAAIRAQNALYSQQVDQYMSQVNATNQVNRILVDFVNKVSIQCSPRLDIVCAVTLFSSGTVML